MFDHNVLFLVRFCGIITASKTKGIVMPKKTFRDAVNVPHKKIGEKIKKIKKNKRPKTGGDKAKKIGKIAGLVLLEFITWVIKYGVFDNQITRKLEDVYAEMKIGKNKQGQNKKFSSWIKKHPEFSSYMTYWLAILMPFTSG